ncbi:hypothetical protein EDD17DRAFT_1512583 [Pisolithus thermaeus]|nr:hypothetical protein EV401DRAFT_1891287 [Pisolithus croceorrhizus]KAI6156255.1 hypothetical protein EDD17DRAFT_1512583 [Pisolithus thermaeus]
MDIQNSGRVRDVPPLGILKILGFVCRMGPGFSKPINVPLHHIFLWTQTLHFFSCQELHQLTGVQDCMGNDKGRQLGFGGGNRRRREVFLRHSPLEVSQLGHYYVESLDPQSTDVRILSTMADRASEEVEEEFIAHLWAQEQ